MTNLRLNESLLARYGAFGIDIPDSELLNKCSTQHQRDKWLEVKTHFYYIFNDLMLYGTGITPEVELVEHLSKNYRTHIRLQTRVYHSLKIACGEKWETLNKMFSYLDPDEYSPLPIPQSPNEIIFHVASDDAYLAFSRCLKNCQLTQSGLYKNALRMRKICRLDSKLDKDQNIAERRKLKRDLERFLEKAGVEKVLTLENFVVGVLDREYRGEKRQNPLTVYRKYRAALFDHISKSTHPREHLGGEEWFDGYRTIIGEKAERYNT